MDKLVTIKCENIGNLLSNPRTNVTFSLSTTVDSGDTGWTPVAKYVSNRVPLVEADLTSKIIQGAFTGSAAGSSDGLDVLVPESTLQYKVTAVGPGVNVSTVGNFSGSL